MDRSGLFFYNTKGKQLASGDLVPIPLYKGMKITIQDMGEDFRVVDWSYHHGEGVKGGGLRITVEESPALKLQTESA